MPHTIIYNPELKIIETTYHGTVTHDEIVAFGSEITRVALAHDGFLTLGDYREARIQLSTLEIYRLPQTLAAVGESPPSKYNRALVIASNKSDFQFFETVTLNQGQYAKVFDDIDTARNWLLDQ